MAVYEALSDEEKYLYVLLQDPSGIDLCEFALADEERDDGCWRAWPFQWTWLRDESPLQIDQCARSVGKSNSIAIRAMAFPFVHPGAEMLITAPEKVHLDAITNKIESWVVNTRLTREMLAGKGGRNSFKHQPFHTDWANGSRIMGRIPQRDGKGVKGCEIPSTPLLTSSGMKRAGDCVVGDTIWTHEGWKEVLQVEHDVAESTYEVNGQGSFPITVSWDHRFYGAFDVARQPGKQKRDFSDGLAWGGAEDVVEDHFYWATPQQIDALPVPQVTPPLAHASSTIVDQSVDAFWWLVGRYVADGFLHSGKTSRVCWVVHPKDQPAVEERLAALDLHYAIKSRDHSSADVISVCSTHWHDWLEVHFARNCDRKKLPAWAFGMPESHRRNLLDGYLAGDGHWSEDRGRHEVSTASEFLAVGLQLLAQSLGHKCSCHHITKISDYTDEIMGVKLKNPAKDAYRFSIYALGRGRAAELDGYLLGKVKSIEARGPQPVVNIITDAHSYLSGSIMSHNQHPLWLEQDEASDYPEPGWTELVETLKRGSEGAVWRAHGVTRGLRDSFYKFTQPGSGWKVHQITAMHRPNWTDAERQEKILQYGSKDAPDYRRNILGAHGDASSPMFVLHRLMACVDSDEFSDYNTDVYRTHRITGEMLEADPMHVLLPLHDSHRLSDRWLTHWIGADLGWTQAPTEILVFGEHRPNKAKASVLELIFRLNLTRVGGPDQVRAIQQLIAHYNPKAFAMDSTGAGLVLYQQLQEDAAIAKVVRGYNFKEKVLVDFDKSIEVDPWTGDAVRDAGIKRQVLEYSTDMLRKYVDEERLLLPWDRNLIGQFQGGSIQAVKAGMDEYGRRRISSSAEDHALDASRMAVLAHALYAIEQMMANQTTAPIIDSFMEF